jgi:hypothetical protein
MTTAQQLYDLPISSSEDSWTQNLTTIEEHLYEFESLPYDLDVSSLNYEIRTIKDHCYDGRRTWTLRTVWFEGVPFMIVQNAGREGNDHNDRFITNVAQYKKFVAAIQALLINDNDLSDVIDVNEERPDLDRFYDQSLHEPFAYWSY